MTTWHVDKSNTQGRRKASESVWREELQGQPKPEIWPYKPSQEGSEGFVLVSVLAVSLAAMFALVACGPVLSKWLHERQRQERVEHCVKEGLAMGVAQWQANEQCEAKTR